MPTKTEYEARLQSYVNETITKVMYFDGNDDEDNPYYLSNDKLFHNVMWGIEFHTSSNRTFGFHWGSEFAHYGLDLLEELWDNNSEILDMSSHNQWAKVIGKKIQLIKVYWDAWLPNEIHSEDKYFPQDIIITFDTGDVYYISVAEYYQKSDSFHFATDAVTIFFDESIAKQYSVPAFTSNTDDI